MSQSYLQPAFEALSDSQLQELLEEHERLNQCTGYLCLQPERVRGRTGILVSAYIDSNFLHLVDLIPLSIAGLSVVVKTDDPRTGEVRIVRGESAE